MKSKAHLTASGLEQIRKLKVGMNTGRKMSTWARPQLNQISKIKTLYSSRTPFFFMYIKKTGVGGSPRETAKALGISPRSVGRYISGEIFQPYKGRYVIKKINEQSGPILEASLFVPLNLLFSWVTNPKSCRVFDYCKTISSRCWYFLRTKLVNKIELLIRL